MSGEIRILDAAAGPELPIVEGGGAALAIVWPGMGAGLRSLHRIWLEPGARTVTLAHPSDAVYYVVDGSGTAQDQSAGEAHELREGAMFHVDAGTSYAIVAGDGPMQIVGGPAPADEAMYAHLADGV